MSSWRYGSAADPAAELDYDLRADLRLRIALLARRLSDHSGSYVGLLGDDIGPGYDLLHGIRDMAALLRQLEVEAVMYFRAGDGTWEQVGQALGISPDTAEQRFADDWADRQERHADADDRRPIDPQQRHLVRDLAELDRWCHQRSPEDGPRQVTDGLVWPAESGRAVRTRIQDEEDRIRAAREAETRREMEAYLAERDRRMAAAMRRLAKKPGLAHTSLWGTDPGPTVHVVARDGVYLGQIRKAHLPAPRGAGWQIEDGPAAADQSHMHPNLQTAVAYLDRVSTPAAAAG